MAADGSTPSIIMEEASEADAALPVHKPLPAALSAVSSPGAESETDTLARMLADEGCPKSSGKGPRLQQVTKGVVSKIVEETEAFFSDRGEKWLRANCGGLLAKDECYGFYLTDLVVGKLAKRKTAIALGEKMRKEHAKVKKKQADSKQRISKLLVAQRDGATATAERERADLLAEPACKELIDLIPTASSCASVQREQEREAKDEAKSEVPAPQPEPELDLDEVARAAQAHAEQATLEAGITRMDYERAMQSLGRLGPRPSFSYLVGKDFVVTDKKGRKVRAPLPEKEREWRDLKVAHWDLTQESGRQLAALAKDAEVDSIYAQMEACDARTAAEVGHVKAELAAINGMMRSADRQAALAAQIESTNAQISALELAAAAERVASRAQNEMQAMKAWGLDHASRPPAAVFDMRGPGIKLKSIDIR